jgi:hypothetical protein
MPFVLHGLCLECLSSFRLGMPFALAVPLCLWHLTPPVSGGPQPTDPRTGTKRALWAVRSTGMLGAGLPLALGSPHCPHAEWPPPRSGSGRLGLRAGGEPSLVGGVFRMGFLGFHGVSWGLWVFMRFVGFHGVSGGPWSLPSWSRLVCLGVFLSARLWHLTASGKRRATAPLTAALAPKRALWPVRFSAMLDAAGPRPPGWPRFPQARPASGACGSPAGGRRAARVAFPRPHSGAPVAASAKGCIPDWSPPRPTPAAPRPWEMRPYGPSRGGRGSSPPGWRLTPRVRRGWKRERRRSGRWKPSLARGS